MDMYGDCRKPEVYCSTCKKQVRVDNTEFLNIEEDIQGRDTMTFICGDCDTQQKSVVTVRR